ncbi:hypothetical protein EV643_108226 [Kribbella sp. VKM Ac-2527]|uniref:Uncharacterized protein n=1 Tax=Kribbella caucasensis TaxID=2512215 RepID=A0A4R6KF96_9ACTN|nr:hypothetical protein EV643_108226 [Kribbella sp. VKM Ac-2527]
MAAIKLRMRGARSTPYAMTGAAAETPALSLTEGWARVSPDGGVAEGGVRS